MAPALVETATTSSGPVPASVYKLDLGQYKEIDLTYIDKDAEAGKTDGPAATVSDDPLDRDIDAILIRKIVPSLSSHMEPSTAIPPSAAL